MNALKLIDRENKRVSEDSEALNRFEICKKLRRQVLRYIQLIESDQWLGSLINANDSLVEALMAFEILDKSVEDDSDSEGAEWDDGGGGAADSRARTMPTRPDQARKPSLSNNLAGLSLDKAPPPKPPAMVPNGKARAGNDRDDSVSDGDAGDDEDNDDDDPFADRNEVADEPKVGRGGATW